MLELENLNLVELNVQEVQEVDGGLLPWIISGALVLGVLGLGIYNGYHSNP